jgi:hypothetical protein
MKIFTTFLIILSMILIIIFSGCKKETAYAFEYKLLKGSSSVYYFCCESNSNEGLPTKTEIPVQPFPIPIGIWGDVIEFDTGLLYIHPDKYCYDLGMSQNTYGGQDPIFYYGDSFNEPGESGHWAPPGGGGGGNTPAFCSDGYTSPYPDPQVNGFCELAFNAQCILGVPNTDERVTSPCNTWKGWQQMDPSIPNCPYCP